MNEGESFKTKPRLLFCTSLYFHQKTSYIEIYKKHLEENFDVIYLDILSQFRSYGREEIEKNIKKKINEFDIICITTDKPYYNFNFFKELKKINNEIVIVYTDGDAVVNFPSYCVNFINEIDLYAVNDSLTIVNFLKKKNINSILFTAVYNQDFYKIANKEKVNDVIFYGGKNKNRQKYLSYIKENNIKLTLIGKGFNSYHTPIDQLNEQINNSKIGLSINYVERSPWRNKFFNEFNECKQIKGKNIEIPLSGTMLLAEYFDDLDHLYINNKEAIFFETKSEMLELIKYYLTNDEKREEIAQAGHLKAIKKFEGNLMAKNFIQEINKIIFNKKKNLNILNYKMEKDYFVTWSLNYALFFFINKNFKSFFDMLKVVKYGVPIRYLVFKVKQVLLNIIHNLKDFLFNKKK